MQIHRYFYKMSQFQILLSKKVLNTAVQLSEAIGYTLGIKVNEVKTRETKQQQQPAVIGKQRTRSSKPFSKQASSETNQVSTEPATRDDAVETAERPQTEE